MVHLSERKRVDGPETLKMEPVMKKICVLPVFVALFICLTGYNMSCAADDPFEAAGATKIMEKPVAPGFILKDISGRPVDFEDYKGKFVLLFFWATW
jgi:cytochrome oxidase Cu insertion factor (SCO1/SenC/PrrC family)